MPASISHSDSTTSTESGHSDVQVPPNQYSAHPVPRIPAAASSLGGRHSHPKFAHISCSGNSFQKITIDIYFCTIDIPVDARSYKIICSCMFLTSTYTVFHTEHFPISFPPLRLSNHEGILP